MEPHAPRFPSFTTSLSNLYGASNYRVAEAQAYALDLDELDRQELALEQTVRALVDRKAPDPIGLSFHRSSPSLPQSSTVNPPGCIQRGVPASVHAGGAFGEIHRARGYHGPVSADDEDDDEDDMEEEEDEEEDMDEMDGDEVDDDDNLFAGDDDEDDHEHGDDHDVPSGEDDDNNDDSMDMSM